MRLWHESLLPLLPNPQLLGQHRECCALRGLGWGRPHSTVNYVFDHPYEYLYVYHLKVLKEMLNRGYELHLAWYRMTYRGAKAPHIIYYSKENEESLRALALNWEDFPKGYYKPNPGFSIVKLAKPGVLVYPEHNDQYLRECLDNLSRKGIHLEVHHGKVEETSL